MLFGFEISVIGLLLLCRYGLLLAEDEVVLARGVFCCEAVCLLKVCLFNIEELVVVLYVERRDRSIILLLREAFFSESSLKGLDFGVVSLLFGLEVGRAVL